MHLASHLERLNDDQLDLIREGVDYYNSLTDMKKRALPYFPNGFTGFGAKNVCAGLCDGNKVYLAVWNLGEAGQVRVNIPNVRNACIGYPRKSDAKVAWDQDAVMIDFPRDCMAVFLEIDV